MLFFISPELYRALKIPGCIILYLPFRLKITNCRVFQSEDFFFALDAIRGHKIFISCILNLSDPIHFPAPSGCWRGQAYCSSVLLPLLMRSLRRIKLWWGFRAILSVSLLYGQSDSRSSWGSDGYCQWTGYKAPELICWMTLYFFALLQCKYKGRKAACCLHSQAVECFRLSSVLSIYSVFFSCFLPLPTCLLHQLRQHCSKCSNNHSAHFPSHLHLTPPSVYFSPVFSSVSASWQSVPDTQYLNIDIHVLPSCRAYGLYFEKKQSLLCRKKERESLYVSPPGAAVQTIPSIVCVWLFITSVFIRKSNLQGTSRSLCPLQWKWFCCNGSNLGQSIVVHCAIKCFLIFLESCTSPRIYMHMPLSPNRKI